MCFILISRTIIGGFDIQKKKKKKEEEEKKRRLWLDSWYN